MTYSSDLLSIDLGYVEATLEAGNIASPIEMAALEISRLNDGDIIFEMDDFKNMGDYRNPILNELSGSPTGPPTFRNWRLEIIEKILKRQVDPLLERWEDFDLGTLAQVIEKTSEGISNIVNLVERLIPVLLTYHGINQNGAQVVALAWLAMNNVKETHDHWVAQGNKAILPDGEFDSFLDYTLQWIESGRFNFGALDGKIAYDEDSHRVIAVQSSYNPHQRRIDFPKPYFTDPLKAFDPELTLIPFIPAFAHECYHEYQMSETGAETNLMQAEVDAEILCTKVYIMTKGFRDADFYEFRGDFARQETLSENSYQNFQESPLFNTPMRVFYDSQSRHMPKPYQPRMYQIAWRELHSGKPAKKLRQRALSEFSYSNVLDITQDLIENTVYLFEKQRQLYGDERFQELAAEEWKKTEPKISGNKKPEFCSMKEANQYMTDRMNALCLIFYLEGIDAAQEYYDGRFLKDMANHFTPYFSEQHCFGDIIKSYENKAYLYY